MGMGPASLFVAGICVALALHCAVAATYTVGGTSGWILPTANTQLFANWAANKSFKLGDKLLFNFSTNAHSVFQVTKANYDSCGLNNPLKTYTTGPATVTLDATGAHYFICGIPGHCSTGQKVAITVSAATATSPTTSPSPSPSSTPSLSPSSSPPSSPSPSSSSPSLSPSSIPEAPPSSSISQAPAPSSTPKAPSPEAPSGTTPMGSPAGPPSSASHLSTLSLTVCVGILYGIAAIFFAL